MGAATGQSLVAVGIPAMDDQHGILMDTLQELKQQLARGNGKTRLGPQMARLVEFADMHFGCEESLLRRHAFPGLALHCGAHQELLDQIRHAMGTADRGSEADLLRDLSRLRGQIRDHIESLDRQYAEWLSERGLF
ncbi:MAG: hemerythrin domain-containing protein [Terracidiphilus sp.]